MAFAQNDLEGTVPSEYRDAVSSTIKAGFVSFYYDGTMFIQNDWVDRPFVPLREYTHYALFHVLKTDPEQTPIESGLADYYPASYLDLADTSSKGPAKVDLSFLEESPASSTQSGPASIVYQGRVWAASFWECRKNYPVRQSTAFFFARGLSHIRGRRILMARAIGLSTPC